MVVGFISDQSPSKANIHLWVDFLNQDTPCIIGAEKIAQKIDAALVFCDIVKVKRGYYEIHIKPMTEDPKSCEEFAITKQYMKMLENCITRQPEEWLWSHKRWKNKR